MLHSARWVAALLAMLIAAVPLHAATYHVAPDGRDDHDGRSPQRAWRTVNHAAARVVAGDTVIIAAGVYTESVRIRATGEKDRPITFKAAPGQRVVFSGSNGALNVAFHASNKSYLHFDGFYFVDFAGTDNFELPWSDRSPGNGYSGVFALHNCGQVRITRCFADGRGGRYAPSLVLARHCTDLEITNCVSVQAMGGGVNVAYSPDTRIEHCVILVPMIEATLLQNHRHQPGSLRHNIFTDSIPVKVGIRLLYNSEPFDEGTDNNCFFTRVPPEQRVWDSLGPMVQWLAAKPGRPGDVGHLLLDPQFAGARSAPALDARGQPLFPPDFLLEKPDLDFPDLFATNPQCVARGVGLVPEAFADFHFNTQTGGGHKSP
jgi:hypothetical protein